MDKINEEKAKNNLIKKLFPHFPTTEKEVDEFEKNNDVENIKLPESIKFQHGINCIKELHNTKGHLHSSDDDTAYYVDSQKYCGRCHSVL